MARRNDIQGLRALAVVSVILYHLGLPSFGGGFVGVDVFFVISGFLITRKLYDDLADGDPRHNLLSFWGARAKRLLPNGLLALLFAVVSATLFLPFFRARETGFDAAAAAFFYSNVHFAQAAVDYFHSKDTPSLVLHFWSLSVEEQFYFLLPIGIAIAGLVRRRRLLAVNILLATVVFVSFAWAQHTIRVSEPSAFYLLQNRMWQFALGGLLGVNFEAAVRHVSGRIRFVGAWVGLVLLIATIVTFQNVIYPGLWAIVPTAAALLLLADDGGAVSRTFSLRPFTWTGDRSYSLYLWHWPLLALANEHFGGRMDVRLLALALAILLALAAYKWIERPIHRSQIAFQHPLRRVAAGAAGVAALATVGLGLGALPPPLDVRARTIAIEAAAHDFGRNYPDDCHLTTEQTALPPCVYGDPRATRTVVLFGDSHAAEWFNPLVAAASSNGWKVVAWTKTSCPAADIAIWYPAAKVPYPQCDVWRNNVLAALSRQPPSAVIIGDFSRYYGWIEDRATGRLLNDTEATAAYRAGLARTVARLKAIGAAVTIIRDNPMMPRNFRDCVAVENDCKSPRTEALSGMDADPSVFPTGAKVADFTDLICGKTCPAMKAGKIIYQDSEHLAASYTLTFEPQFAAILTSLAAAQPPAAKMVRSGP